MESVKNDMQQQSRKMEELKNVLQVAEKKFEDMKEKIHQVEEIAGPIKVAIISYHIFNSFLLSRAMRIKGGRRKDYAPF